MVDGLLELVVGLELLVVAVKAWAALIARLARIRLLLAGGRHPRAIARRLLQTVRQVHRIEVVALLIWLIYLVLILLVWGRELD